jgi:gliding motility-associated-like protein
LRPELEKYHLIDRYLDGQLSVDELDDFKVRLATDSDFYEEVEIQKMSNLVIMASGYDKLRDKMTADIQELDRKSAIRKSVIVGGTTIFLGLVALWWFLPFKPSATPDLKSPVASKSIEVKKVSVFNEVSSVKTNVGVQAKTPQVFVSKSATKSTNKELPKVTATQVAIASTEPSEALQTKDLAPVSVHSDHKLATTEPLQESIVVHAVPLKQVQVEEVQKKEEVKKVETPKKEANKVTFHPEFETWSLPVTDQEAFTVSIFNRGGQLMFKRNSNEGHLQEWNGTSNSGSPLDAGVYVYVIEHQNGAQETGQITLAR